MSAARNSDRRTGQGEAQLSPHRICLGLGSNIEPAKNLPYAVELLCHVLEVEAVSSAWETPAVGTPGPDFLNAAMLVHATCSAEDLKYQFIRKVEARVGRVRTGDRNAPRPIDIDILIFNGVLLEPQLWEHAYLAVPVAELLPDYVSPETGETLAQVAERLACDTCIQPRRDVLPGSKAAA